MFSQLPARPALLSTFAVLLLLVISAGAPIAGAGQAAPNAAPASSVGPAAALPCNLAIPFNANNFPSTPNVNNPLLSYPPGTEFILEGRVNVGGQRLAHQVILIVNDLTKVIHGVRTVVLWDRDFNTGVLTESELAFHTQDTAGNIWNLGEYPAQYIGGAFTDAPDTWFEGLANGQAGLVIPGNPQTGTPKFFRRMRPASLAIAARWLRSASSMSVIRSAATTMCW